MTILSDEKLVKLVNDYNGEPTNVDCITYAIIKNGIKSINPKLDGDAVFVKGGVDGVVEDVVGTLAEVADGWLADALDGAADALNDDYTVFTSEGDVLNFYLFDKLGSKIVCKLTIPRNKISKIKKSKILLWYTFKLLFHEGSEIKISITSKMPGIKKQSENVQKLVQILGV